ncbi:phosphoribosylamine--glycine ligase [Streptomyces sp. NPDC088757]|uniref:phosphoribosylamine--glycine ligase n=1 Tax=Streptomyces sp. NPDC088757 TaxID=3365889 RepID=UPI00381BDCEE
MNSRVLVVDSTGRGHALCDLFVRTDAGVTVYYGPGNEALDEPRIVSVPSIRLDDPTTALAFLAHTPVDFVFVSNIDALCAGYVDVLRAHGHVVIGPSRAAAQLEASKERGKRFCRDHGLATAEYAAFDRPGAALAHVRSVPYLCVVKTDGLTPDGDGSVVCSTVEEAEHAVARFASVQGEDFHVVVEERLYGREISVFALLDGTRGLVFPTGLDYKRTLENDAGKNCDGMGSVAPHPDMTPALEETIRRTLVEPLLEGLRDEGLDYTGFVYIGAMNTASGLRVIEINTRFGDSEAEAVLPSVQNDFTRLCRSVLAGTLERQELVTDGLVRCSVALVQGSLDERDPDTAPGWPFGAFETGQPVRGLSDVDRRAVRVFHANTTLDEHGTTVSSGGRVLHVVGSGTTLSDARAEAYRQIARVSFPGMRYRTDIGALDASPAVGASPARADTQPPVVVGIP